MPNMANITVKKSDGTTDVVYNALSAAGGDGSVAAWRQDTGASADLPTGYRATLQVASTWNGPRTARRMTMTYKMPYSTLNTTTGKYETRDMDLLSATFTLPSAIPPAVADEAVAQGLNLLASVLIKDSCKAGFAPS